MLANQVKHKLQSGEVVLGTMVTVLRTPGVVHVLADAGYDVVFIDMEHSTYTLETAAELIEVARLVGITPFVRVADLLYPCVARPLDAGAMGLMLPRSETRAQVERFIDMLRYPPLGSRGSSVPKGHNAYRSEPAHEFAAKANSEVMAIIQIERQAAVEDIDDLLTVPGLDAALMGLNDLALSLGVPADPMDPTVIEAVQHVTTACERHSIPLGVHTGSLEALQYWAERGMRILLHSTAVSMTAAGAQASVAALRGIAASLT